MAATTTPKRWSPSTTMTNRARFWFGIAIITPVALWLCAKDLLCRAARDPHQEDRQNEVP